MPPKGAKRSRVLVEAGYTPAVFGHLAQLTVPVDASRGAALGLYSVLLGAGQVAGNLLDGPFAARWQMDGVLALTAILAVVSLRGVRRMAAESAAGPLTGSCTGSAGESGKTKS